METEKGKLDKSQVNTYEEKYGKISRKLDIYFVEINYISLIYS